MFTHKNSEEAIKNVSRQKRLTSKEEIDLFFAGISGYRNEYKQEIKNPFKKYGRILDLTHSIISCCPDLTNNEKLEYCNIERYFIKSVFKELALKS